PTALSANQSLNATAMDMVRACTNRRCERNTARIVRIHRLNHPDTPEAVDRIGPINVFPTRRRRKDGIAAATEISRTAAIKFGRRAVPNNVHTTVVAGVDPRENVVV